MHAARPGLRSLFSFLKGKHSTGAKVPFSLIDVENIISATGFSSFFGALPSLFYFAQSTLEEALSQPGLPGCKH
eukprot:1161993-Pelagomonas_calceolata.AAC.6